MVHHSSSLAELFALRASRCSESDFVFLTYADESQHDSRFLYTTTFFFCRKGWRMETIKNLFLLLFSPHREKEARCSGVDVGTE